MPESYGLYFSWGNTDGHPAGAGYNFSQEVYDNTPAAAITENLSLSEDAARVNLGAPWRMPTTDEFQELNDNCTHIWTSLNGVYGVQFTSNVNGKTLFLPAAGRYDDTTLSGRNERGFYRTSLYQSDTGAYICYFYETGLLPHSGAARRLGFSIRAVQDGTPNRSIDPQTSVSEPKEEETPTEEEPKDDNMR